MTSEEGEDHLRTPISDLDLSMSLTNTSWGSSEVSQELKEVLNKFYVEKDEDGQDFVTKSSLWGLLSYYNRDIRLGNLTEWNGELAACRYYLDLAGNLLLANMIEPFLISLSKAITILETSQSKGGFLRRAMNTLRQEHYSEQVEAQKKKFFGGAGKTEGGY